MKRYYGKTQIEMSTNESINKKIEDAISLVEEYDETAEDILEYKDILGKPTYVMRKLDNGEKVSINLYQEILKNILRVLRVELRDRLEIGKQLINAADLLIPIRVGDYKREIVFSLREMLLCDYGGGYDLALKDAIILDLYNGYRGKYNQGIIKEYCVQRGDDWSITKIDNINSGILKCIESLSQNKRRKLFSKKGIQSTYSNDRICIKCEDEKYQMIMTFYGMFNEEMQIKILLDENVGNFLNSNLSQGKTFIAAKEAYETLCCMKEKEVWQSKESLQKDYYIDCLFIERMTGFNLAMTLYEGLLCLIEPKGDEYEESVLKIIDSILYLKSPILRRIISQTISSYVCRAFSLGIINTKRKALEEIEHYLNIYINDVVTLYELGIKYRHFINVDKDDKREVNFSEFSLLRQINSGDESQEQYLDEYDREILEEYEEINLLDKEVERILSEREYGILPKDIEQTVGNSEIWKDLEKAKKDDYRYKFFVFIMKNIIAKNVIVTDDND